MAPPNANHWITDPEYIDLLNYIIKQTRDVEAPMSVQRMAREFKERSGAAQKEKTLKDRIYKLRTKIHSFEHIDTNTKVRMMFALSASVNAGFLEELEEDAFVEVDDKQRITQYKADDGSFELRGDHSSSANNISVQLGSKQSIRSIIIDYFENNNDSYSVPQNEKEKEVWNLIEFITEKCENVNSPLNILQLVKDFKNHFGISKQIRSIEKRVDEYRREIQALEFLDTHSKVQQLFGLSAKIDTDYLERLRKDALVNVDEKNRIVHYKANDGSLELSGDHSMSAKVKIAMREIESKRNCRKWIIEYFENKNDSNSFPKDEEEKEKWNFIEFIAEKCENVNTPLNIHQLTKDFNYRFGIARSFYCIYTRVKGYCREIQTLEFLETHSKVRQLFCLSGTLNSNFLTELRKDAVVDVDDLNRITKYTANNGRLILYGDHSSSAKKKLGWIERKKKQNAVKNNCNFEDDEMDHSESDSDEYSGGEFDLDDYDNHLDKSEYLIEPSNEVLDYYNKNPGKIHSPRDMSIDDNFDFDPSTERSQRTEETKIGEDNKGKRKNSSNTTPISGKKPNKCATGSSSSKRTGSSSNDSMRPNEVSIKIEVEEPVEVKPETSHNSKIKFLEVMQSLIVSLNSPSLSWIQSKIHQKIQKLKKSDEVILNIEIVLIMQLLIARITEHSVVNLSKNVESVNLSNFLCLLKATIQISKLSGADDLVKNISELIEESQNERIPMEKVANALLVTLDIDGF